MKAGFRVCCNCGAHAPRRKVLCNNPNGCGPTSRADRRRFNLKSVWREPTAEELEAVRARRAATEALIQSLLAD